MTHSRLDQLLVQRGLVRSREEAKGYILAGKVFVDKRIVTKAGWSVRCDAEIHVQASQSYVSRGGIKLEKALEAFQVSVEGKVALDVGASTGGFTHCLLKKGAEKVYSVDVGRNQLAYALRQHPKVVSMEELHVKKLAPNLFVAPPDIAVIDLSFMSLTQALPSVLSVLVSPNIIALVKPQFEVGQSVRNFKGVVYSPEDHINALLKVYAKGCELGLCARALCYSPIKGPKGNIEFFMYWTNTTASFSFEQELEKTVAQAHKELA